jgi:hypothetical protein
VKVLPEPRDPFQALMEDLFAGQIEAARWRTLLRDLTRLVAYFRPLMDAMERGSGGTEGPQLLAPALPPQP